MESGSEIKISEKSFYRSGTQLLHVRHDQTLVTARLVPEREFYAVPEPQFVVDGPEIVFDDVFCGSNFIGDFFVFESLSDECNDSLLAVAWC